MSKSVPVITYIRSGPDAEWIEESDAKPRYFPIHIADTIGYALYIEPGFPLIERPGTGGTYYWWITPVNSKQLIHKGRKP